MPTPPDAATPPARLPQPSGLSERLAATRARVAEACAVAGRPPEDVTLVAVSKTYSAADVRAALAAGQRHFGENRVQEAAGKFPDLRRAHPDLRLHLIGALQSNKAREAARIADVIESLDRERLADALDDAAQRDGRLPDLLVQVNVGSEAQKSGVARDRADAFIALCRRRFAGRLRGLMCVPPALGDPAPHFVWLAACAARHGLGTVSMGMSADFELAIRHGATEVRVGSAIFGARP